MTQAKSMPRKRPPLPLRILIARPKLLLSIAAGVTVALLLPAYSDELHGVTRILVGWDVGVALYLILAYWMIAHCDVSETKRQSLLQDEGGFAILALTVVSAAASFGAVFVWLEIATRDETFAIQGMVFLLLTIVLSWSFIHTIFALHYAHEFYPERGEKGGLIFPRDPQPTYWDFVYLAFSIGTSAEVSDVAITSKRIRRTVTVHGIVSFFFNVSIIALTVGLIGDAIQN